MAAVCQLWVMTVCSLCHSYRVTGLRRHAVHEAWAGHEHLVVLNTVPVRRQFAAVPVQLSQQGIQARGDLRLLLVPPQRARRHHILVPTQYGPLGLLAGGRIVMPSVCVLQRAYRCGCQTPTDLRCPLPVGAASCGLWRGSSPQVVCSAPQSAVAGQQAGLRLATQAPQHAGGG